MRAFWSGLALLAGLAALVGLVAVASVAALLRLVPADQAEQVPARDGTWLAEAPAGDAHSGGGADQDDEDEWLNALDTDGVECDGDSADDLQAAVDSAADAGQGLVIPSGAECVLDDTLEVPSGSWIEASGALVRGAQGEFRPRPDRESLVELRGSVDVTINGGVWSLPEDEGANVFDIREASSVTLSWLTASGAREDGVYIGRPTSERVTLEGVLTHSNGRSGISITTGRDIEVIDSHAHYNGHVLDMRGLTIEPTSDGGPLTGVRIVGLETSGNARSGAGVSLGNLDEDEEDVDIVFERYRSVAEPVGLRVSKGTVGGSVRVVDSEFVRTEGVALQLKDRWATAFQVEIVRPTIREWGTEPTGRARHDSAISIYTSDNDVDEPLGGVSIVEPAITGGPEAGDRAYYLYVGDNRDEPIGVERTELLDPQVLRNGRGLSLDGGVHVGRRTGQDESARAGTGSDDASSAPGGGRQRD